LTAGYARGRGGKQYARYWCWTKNCNAVGISRDGLENHFVSLFAMMQPTAEQIAKLPDIAASVELETAQAACRTGTATANEPTQRRNDFETRCNRGVSQRRSDAEDFDDMTAHIKGKIRSIEEQLKSLSSEHLTMESTIFARAGSAGLASIAGLAVAMAISGNLAPAPVSG
jgi:hypothetical protein